MNILMFDMLFQIKYRFATIYNPPIIILHCTFIYSCINFNISLFTSKFIGLQQLYKKCYIHAVFHISCKKIFIFDVLTRYECFVYTVHFSKPSINAYFLSVSSLISHPFVNILLRMKTGHRCQNAKQNLCELQKPVMNHFQFTLIVKIQFLKFIHS